MTFEIARNIKCSSYTKKRKDRSAVTGMQFGNGGFSINDYTRSIRTLISQCH